MIRSINFIYGAVICIIISNSTVGQNIDKIKANYIYFTSEVNSSGRDIVRISMGKSAERKKLTYNNGKNHYPHHNGPKLSPDGKKIAFHSDTDRHDRYSIWTMDVDGGNLKRITSKEGLYVSWSPDGKSLVYSGRRDGVWEIITIPSKGGNELLLTKNYKDNDPPDWGAHCSYHPSGKFLIFSYVREKVLYKLDFGTGEVTRLSPKNHRYTNPVYSKDGKRIAVNRRIDNSYDLITISSDGGQVRVISKNVISYSSPAWSSTDNEILFTGQVNGDNEIFKVNLFNGKEEQVTNVRGFDAMPTW